MEVWTAALLYPSQLRSTANLARASQSRPRHRSELAARWLLSHHLVVHPLNLAIITDLLPQYCEFALQIWPRVLPAPSQDSLAIESKRNDLESSCLKDGCVTTSSDGYDRGRC